MFRYNQRVPIVVIQFYDSTRIYSPHTEPKHSAESKYTIDIYTVFQVMVVYGSISDTDVLRYERGCWDEAQCDNAAKNTGDDLTNQTCIQQNGNYTCHSLDTEDSTTIANAINANFAEVSKALPALDFTQLPAFLPAPQQLPTLHVWDIYKSLLAVALGRITYH
ncbi:Hypp5395 [Branchiostoma lanceolatum]|uniref:Hypp5395 protein n=1 Tax=Branchiostoma lanceolatum TaxID=7740 RepID=A0A8K0AH18_BRALA|nr:Hypp5395 [Branchiostoma lanceolatum]